MCTVDTVRRDGPGTPLHHPGRTWGHVDVVGVVPPQCPRNPAPDEAICVRGTGRRAPGSGWWNFRRLLSRRSRRRSPVPHFGEVVDRRLKPTRGWRSGPLIVSQQHRPGPGRGRSGASRRAPALPASENAVRIARTWVGAGGDGSRRRCRDRRGSGGRIPRCGPGRRSAGSISGGDIDGIMHDGPAPGPAVSRAQARTSVDPADPPGAETDRTQHKPLLSSLPRMQWR